MKQRPKLGILIKFIHNAIERDCNSMLKEMNLTTAQLDVLMYLLMNQEKEVNQIDIEKEFKVKNPTVTGILKRLENKGLIVRTVGEKDARRKKIMVTDKSRVMKIKVLEKGEMIENRLLAGFSDKDKEELRGFLERMLHNFL
jgi:DNA-binding MarR family transcriptional regulator